MTEAQPRILWTSNIVLPAAAEALGLTQTPFGGWLSLMTERLAATGRFQIGVAMRAEGVPFTRIETGGVIYYALPARRQDRFDVAQGDCEKVLADFAPDLLHVEGAEMRHARRFLATWRGRKLLSMQGVLQGYAQFELGQLPLLKMLSPLRPRIMATALTLMLNYWFRFRPRLEHERQSMAAATHVMGRTLWDRAQAQALAPQAAYTACNRILRDTFYRTIWDQGSATPHSIFIGNGA
ncbi:MAG: hypothetical protein AAGP08_08810, partial [Pseudomonadota bacterium]